ncbi:MAG TPA: DinB family protein [Candidatus Tectomicrobia bacterium]|nr:DinB family protein [Candidatus Tectomicrobia bacterium]
MSLGLVRDLYDYHRWANRRLFAVAERLGDEACGKSLGPHFSFPTVTRMFGHVYGADWVWLQRWNGISPTTVPGAEFGSLSPLRAAWDALEAEQERFLEALGPADLDRVVAYRTTEGTPYRVALGALLQHVATHAVHHRSEIATMLTTIAGSPPDTGMITYVLDRTGQRPA